MEIKGEIYNFTRVSKTEGNDTGNERDRFFLPRISRKKTFRPGERNKLFREIEIREALLFSFRSLIEVVGIGDFILKKKSFVDFTPACFCLINSGSTNSLSLYLFSFRSVFSITKVFLFSFQSRWKNSIVRCIIIIIGNVIQTTFSNVLEFKSLPFEFTLTALETIRVRRNSEYECIKGETKDSKFFSLLFQSLYAFLTLAGYAKSLDNFVDFLFGIISLVAALNFLQHFTRFLFTVFFQTIGIIALYPLLPFVPRMLAQLRGRVIL